MHFISILAPFSKATSIPNNELAQFNLNFLRASRELWNLFLTILPLTYTKVISVFRCQAILIFWVDIYREKASGSLTAAKIPKNWWVRESFLSSAFILPSTTNSISFMEIYWGAPDRAPGPSVGSRHVFDESNNSIVALHMTVPRTDIDLPILSHVLLG